MYFVYFRALTCVMEQSVTECDSLVSCLSLHCDESKQTLDKVSKSVEDNNRDIKRFNVEVSEFCTKTQDVSANCCLVLFVDWVKTSYQCFV